MHRHATEAAGVYAGHSRRRRRIHLQKEQLLVAINHRFRREENVCAENSVDRRLVEAFDAGPWTASQIDCDQWLVEQIQRAKPQRFGSHNVVERAVHVQAGWNLAAFRD